MSDTMTAGLLRASPGAALSGHIAVPGDKSISHRALILGGLAEGETRIEGLLEGQDVLHTASAVRALLLMGAAAGFPLRAIFTGDRSLCARPMKRILEPLRLMGAAIEERDRLPVSIQGGGLHGISHLNRAASAQVKSAILLAGLHAQGEVEVIEPMPSRDHSERMLRAFGCAVEMRETPDGRRISLGAHRRLTATEVMVPGDPSSAAFPLVAALIAPNSEVTAYGVLTNPLRTGLFATLLEMGADLTFANRRIVGGEEVADITARSSALTAVEVDADRAPSMIDEFPILAIAAAFAAGQTAMHGLAELRVKESDRLGAIVEGLRRCGVSAAIVGNSLLVDGCDGPPEGGASVRSWGDHRIAMSFLILGLAARKPVTVDEAEMIGTSFPAFAGLMNSLGARIAGPEA